MTDLGKRIRIERILDRKSKRTIIVPMDHGMSDGTIKGLENLAEMVDKVALGGANAVLERSGMVGAGHRQYGKDIGLIIHLSGATSLAPDPNRKVLVCSVERALPPIPKMMETSTWIPAALALAIPSLACSGVIPLLIRSRVLRSPDSKPT